MSRTVFSFEATLEPRFAALAWDVFFAERGRGISLERHFPWLGNGTGQHFAYLKEDDELVAGLCIREVAAAKLMAATIGLVCVRADRRGQGLGRYLLDASLQVLDERGVEATTLWTGKPEVYQSQGFKLDDAGLLLHVDGWHPASRAKATVSDWPDSLDNRGLPPYAVGGQRLRMDGAEAVVLTDHRGCAVAEWQGDEDAVIALLAATMPARWRLHSLVGDTLPTRLARRGATIQTEAMRLQMWRWHPGQKKRAVPPLRVLDRI
jgi:GNAT superfamily N-acetyltransferase